MPRALVGWPIRVAAFAIVGVLTFLLQPPGATAVPAQLAGYLIAGVGLVAWAVSDRYPAAARYRAWLLPVGLAVTAAAGGFASTAGINENNCPAILANMAAAAAGASLSLLGGWLITLVGIFAIDVNWIFYQTGFTQISNFLLLPLVPLSGLLIGRIIHGRQLHAEQSAVMLTQTQELLSEQARADVLGERARIAREIHDVLAHSLGALGIQIQAARATLTDHQDIERAIAILLTAQRMAADGLTETRRAVHALRMDSRPLNEELERVTEDHRERYQVKTGFEVNGVVRPVPPNATIALLRTAQEALFNAAKHASGQEVRIRLAYGDHDVQLTVRNDLGDGWDGGDLILPQGSVAGGYGLTGMRERLRLLDGALLAGPHEGQWTVTARLPLTPAAGSTDAVS